MHASDGAHEDVHKKVLGPNTELHEAHRQVNIYFLLTQNFCSGFLIKYAQNYVCVRGH